MGRKKTSKSKHLRLSQKYGQDPDPDQDSGFNALKHEIQEFRDYQVHLEESFQNFQAMYQHKYFKLVHALQQERHRCQLLEAQLNDLFELHWTESMILKQELAVMKEKTAFLDKEISMDVHEALEACEISLFRLEQQQNTERHEGLEHDTAERRVGQLISVLLALTAVLICASIMVNFGIPLMKACWDIPLALLYGLLPLQTVGLS
ncbi:transmembrane and coiled-coil domains protein 1-like [Cheilinus undulatus]|uniref:transmembrane and coiled-coil domains protein 1-like n=1 Tax=Cheilinus undulatus TaxID=241271 RepID=UPI001BD562FC|nr:transmembrane and coiled-coil domains protein 1-like [Cheilinus undulatus]